ALLVEPRNGPLADRRDRRPTRAQEIGDGAGALDGKSGFARIFLDVDGGDRVRPIAAPGINRMWRGDRALARRAIAEHALVEIEHLQPGGAQDGRGDG